MENTHEKISEPDTLYQYRPPEQWAADNLRRYILYFSSPAGFNDQREWCVPPRIPENATWQDIRRFLQKHKTLYRTDYAHIKAKGLSRKDAIRDLNEVFAKIFRRWRCEDGGVSCFSTSQHNMLLWARYAQNSEGFCLAFDPKMRLWAGEVLKPVIYSETPPNDNALKIQESTEDLFSKLLTQKSMYWKDEKEWRFMRKDIPNANTTGRESRYARNALQSVFLGGKMEADKRAEIRGILMEEYLDTPQLWQGVLNDAEDKVDFRPANEAAQAEEARRKYK